MAVSSNRSAQQKAARMRRLASEIVVFSNSGPSRVRGQDEMLAQLIEALVEMPFLCARGSNGSVERTGGEACLVY
jgi:hypothetical protein